MKQKQTKCLNPRCDSPAQTRGLCASCYNRASVLVRRGQTTWEALEKKGRALPAHPKSTAAWLLAKV